MYTNTMIYSINHNAIRSFSDALDHQNLMRHMFAKHLIDSIEYNGVSSKDVFVGFESAVDVFSRLNEFVTTSPDKIDHSFERISSGVKSMLDDSLANYNILKKECGSAKIVFNMVYLSSQILSISCSVYED